MTGECLSHGDQWRARLESLVDGLAGRLLPGQQAARDRLGAVVCSCEDRDKEDSRAASASFGYTSCTYTEHDRPTLYILLLFELFIVGLHCKYSLTECTHYFVYGCMVDGDRWPGWGRVKMCIVGVPYQAYMHGGTFYF